MSPTVALLVAFLLVLLNGFFVAAEFALVKVRATRLAELSKRGSGAAKLAQHSVKHLDEYLSATQLGITLASIGLGWVGEPSVAALLRPLFDAYQVPEHVIHPVSFAIAFTLISVAHIVLGELAPKSWAIQKSEQVSIGVAYPLHWFYILLRPAIKVLNGMAGALLRLFGIRPASDQEGAHTEEELRMLLAASGQHGVLNETEVELAAHVLGFATKDVHDVMVPRVDLVALDLQKPLETNLEIAKTKPYSRYPVINGDHDEVVGMVHIKDLFTLEPGAEIGSVLREVLRVPPSKPLDRMLRDFQKEKIHMAIVQDEFGGTAGLVTLEDVIEEIVGDISDEYDPEGADLVEEETGKWLVSGRTRLAEINERVGLSLTSKDHDTAGGLVYEHLGRNAKPAEGFQHGGAELTVVQVDGRRIALVRIRRLFDQETPEEEGY
jgi:CBS domain containing-hemolysin-like protein